MAEGFVMPARIQKIRHDENTRAKIKVAELINRFQKHFDGEIELSPTQIQAGKILLDRALPILQSVEVSGEITTSKVIRSPAVSDTATAWASEHIPPQHTEH
jgi:hypothetical protein